MFGLGKKKIQGSKVTFAIEGMHCTSCAMNIDGELEDTEGVLEVSTSYAKSQTTVTYDENKVTKKQMLKAIERAGYEAIESDKEK